mmetsp:Transcript_32429/g.87033  ORF Transcript_32429/g.87033 Transcript_32429/m.87033 type:complete len:218 (-) Transcript_32429:4265-4918(-)
MCPIRQGWVTDATTFAFSFVCGQPMPERDPLRPMTWFVLMSRETPFISLLSHLVPSPSTGCSQSRRCRTKSSDLSARVSVRRASAATMAASTYMVRQDLEKPIRCRVQCPQFHRCSLTLAEASCSGFWSSSSARWRNDTAKEEALSIVAGVRIWKSTRSKSLTSSSQVQALQTCRCGRTSIVACTSNASQSTVCGHSLTLCMFCGRGSTSGTWAIRR